MRGFDPRYSAWAFFYLRVFGGGEGVDVGVEERIGWGDDTPFIVDAFCEMGCFCCSWRILSLLYVEVWGPWDVVVRKQGRGSDSCARVLSRAIATSTHLRKLEFLYDVKPHYVRLIIEYS